MFKFLNKFDDLSESLLFFVAAIITGGFGDRIIPHTLLEYLDEDRVSQLLCSFFLVIFSIEVFTDKVKSIIDPLKYSLLIFVLYIAISKQSGDRFLITVGLLMINYFVRKQAYILKNNVTDKEDKNRKNKIKNLNKASTFILILTTIVTAHGMYNYFIKQYNEHRKTSKNFLEFLGKFFLEGSNKIYKEQKRVFRK
jgi:hypothetical protein